MRIVHQNNKFTLYNGDINLYDSLPNDMYEVSKEDDKGFSLKKRPDFEIKEGKIYGTHATKVDKVINSFKKFDRNMGIILSGDKGIGKSLFAKMLAISMQVNGYPVIVLDKYNEGIGNFINSIDQECMILIDEYDKTFANANLDYYSRNNQDSKTDPQTEMLSVFDGTNGGAKKMFVITCNDTSALSSYLLNRPGRFHYHFKFKYPSSEEVKTYLEDHVSYEYYDAINDVIDFAKKVPLNFDALRAIAYELNNGEKFSDIIDEINIAYGEDINYEVRLVYMNKSSLSGFLKLSMENMYNTDEQYYSCRMKDNNNCCYCTVRFKFEDSSTESSTEIIIDGKNVEVDYDVSRYGPDDKSFKKNLDTYKKCTVDRLEITKAAKSPKYFY